MVTSVEPCQEDELHTAARAGLGGVGLFNGRQWTQKVPLFSVRILVYLELPSMISLAEPEYRNSKKDSYATIQRRLLPQGSKVKIMTLPQGRIKYIYISPKFQKQNKTKLKQRMKKGPTPRHHPLSLCSSTIWQGACLQKVASTNHLPAKPTSMISRIHLPPSLCRSITCTKLHQINKVHQEVSRNSKLLGENTCILCQSNLQSANHCHQ